MNFVNKTFLDDRQIRTDWVTTLLKLLHKILTSCQLTVYLYSRILVSSRIADMGEASRVDRFVMNTAITPIPTAPNQKATTLSSARIIPSMRTHLATTDTVGVGDTSGVGATWAQGITVVGVIVIRNAIGQMTTTGLGAREMGQMMKRTNCFSNTMQECINIVCHMGLKAHMTSYKCHTASYGCTIFEIT